MMLTFMVKTASILVHYFQLSKRFTLKCHKDIINILHVELLILKNPLKKKTPQKRPMYSTVTTYYISTHGTKI